MIVIPFSFPIEVSPQPVLRLTVCQSQNVYCCRTENVTLATKMVPFARLTDWLVA
jgi:hypothetical protein